MRYKNKLAPSLYDGVDYIWSWRMQKKGRGNWAVICHDLAVGRTSRLLSATPHPMKQSCICQHRLSRPATRCQRYSSASLFLFYGRIVLFRSLLKVFVLSCLVSVPSFLQHEPFPPRHLSCSPKHLAFHNSSNNSGSPRLRLINDVHRWSQTNTLSVRKRLRWP